jgi:hypothetical protein
MKYPAPAYAFSRFKRSAICTTSRNIEICILSTHCIYGFCIIFALNTVHFPKHDLRLACIVGTEFVLCETGRWKEIRPQALHGLIPC